MNNSINETNSALDVGAHLFGATSETWANVGMIVSFANLYLGILELLLLAPVLEFLMDAT